MTGRKAMTVRKEMREETARLDLHAVQVDTTVTEDDCGRRVAEVFGF